MESTVNQYSFVVIGLLVATLVYFLVWNILGIKVATIALILTCILLVGFKIFLSTAASNDITTEEFNNSLLNGKPALVVLYSDF